MQRSAKWFFLTFSLFVAPQAPADDGETDLVLILDASNSMWGQIDGVNKIVIAREAVGGLVDQLPDTSNVGLVAYGHRREGDCDDIEVLSAIEPVDKAGLKSTINAINPKGRTPITASISSAVELVQGREQSSIVLISDGLETCGLDPCTAVRTAREEGAPFVLHVIGFDVAGEDTAQLECAAQAGGGLYLNAENATQLSEALLSAYERPVEPDGRLVVGATANGERQDASIHVTDADSGEHIAGGRTYAGEETNPRRIALEDGRYQAVVSAVGIKGTPKFDFAFEIVDGQAVERDFDFSSGELAVQVTRNGELSDAVVNVYAAGERVNVAGGRTYRSSNSNPRVLRVAAGTYDVTLRSVELENGAEPRFEGIVVTGGERSDISHEFASGELRVGVRRGDALVDATVNVFDTNGQNVARGRTYTAASSNPKTFSLVPGDYRIEVREIRGEERDLGASVVQGGTAEVDVDLAP